MNNSMLKQMALNMIMNNPNVCNTPFGQQAIQAIQSGDDAKGAELANNFLNSVGMSKAQVLSQARNQFNIR